MAAKNDDLDSIFSKKPSRIDVLKPSESVFRVSEPNASTYHLAEEIACLKKNQMYLIKLVEQLRQEISNDRIAHRQPSSQTRSTKCNTCAREESPSGSHEQNLLKELKKKLLLANLRIIELQGQKT